MIRHSNTFFINTFLLFLLTGAITNASVAQAAPTAKASATPKSTTPKVTTPKSATRPTTKPVASPQPTATSISTSTSTSAPVATPAPSAEIVATVNGEAILKKDVERLLNAAIARDKNLQGTGEDVKKKVAAARQQIITDRIDLVLWTQEARRRKVTPAKADLDKIIAQNKTAFKDNAAWVKFLNGRSEADYRKTISQEMAITELFARLTADVSVSAEEIRTYYEANKEKFKAPEMVRVHHIFFIMPKNANETEKGRVLAQANDVLKKAQAPNANFEALAREFSQASDVMQDSGGLPLFWRDRFPLPKEFQDAAFAAQAGQIVGPVQTSMGVHIIKVDEKIPSGPAPLTNDLKTDIRFALKTKKNDERLQSVLKDLKAKSDIQII